MRVVSFVPSWTETLIECGVQVVGRTRFCIHPKTKVADIPIVGGTKDCNWKKLEELNPDLVLFDREENLKEMADQCPVSWHATHVTGISDMPRELAELSQLLRNQRLNELSRRWAAVLEKSPQPKGVPGVLKWLRETSESPKRFAYVIWKDPWMAAGADTFIGSIFEYLGFENYFDTEKYPKFEMSSIPKDVVLLFSSEPYPFEKKPPQTEDIPNAMAIVDGESFSWFGIRSLKFLEAL